MKSTDPMQILEFMRISERLKNELRHSWLSGGRQESVADHCWHMGLLAMLLSDSLDERVDLKRVLMMIQVHDLVEALVGDTPFTASADLKQKKTEMERDAIEQLAPMLPGKLGSQIRELWLDFEARQSGEAKFVRALDNLEAQIQHNLANLETWEDLEYDLVYTKMDKHCAYDTYLKSFCDAVKLDSERAMLEFGIDPASIRQRAGAE